MSRAQLRRRPARAVALGAGILVAALSFGLLSSETATSKLQVNRTVSENFRAAYDILVRPNHAQTPFERRHHLVDNGFLSGLFGGISLDQYHQIASIHGVSVAAPVANVGSLLLSATVFVRFPPSVHPSQRTVYRIATTWNVHGGLSRYPSAPSYVYYTPHQLTFTDVEAGTEKAGPAGQALDCAGAGTAPPNFGAVALVTATARSATPTLRR